MAENTTETTVSDENSKTPKTVKKPINAALFTKITAPHDIPVTEKVGRTRINNVIVDRRAHSVEFGTVMDLTSNIDYLSYALSDTEVAKQVIEFFSSRAVIGVMRSLFPGNTWRIGGGVFTKVELLKELTKSGVSNSALLPIAEMLSPIFIKNNFMSTVAKFTSRRQYGDLLANMDDLVRDIMRQELEGVIKTVTDYVSYAPSRTYSVNVIAEEVSEACFRYSFALRNMATYADIINDMIKAVRFRVDVDRTGWVGESPVWISERPEIEALSNNFNFVMAAMSLPAGSFKPAREEIQIDKWVPVVYTMIRNSDRYGIMSATEFTSRYSVNVLSNMKGVPSHVTITENSVINGACSALYITKDAIVDQAIVLEEPRERISELLASSIGDVGKLLSTVSVSKIGDDVRQVIIESAKTHAPTYSLSGPLTGTVFSRDNEWSLPDPGYNFADVLAAMNADFIYLLKPDENNNPRLLYVYEDSEHESSSYSMVAGKRIGYTYYTTSPYELLLLKGNSDSTATISVPNQLVDKRAIQTRVLNFNIEDYTSNLGERVAYSFDVLGISVRGNLKLSDFHSMRRAMHLRSIVPLADRFIVDGALARIAEVLAGITRDSSLTDAQKRLLKRNLASSLLSIAEGVSPSFRKEVHQAVRLRATATLTEDEGMKIGSTMHQSAFVAITNVLALHILLVRMGWSDEASSYIMKIMKDNDVKMVLAELGSSVD